MARFDNIGMFWEDVPVSRKRGEVSRVMPPIPDTGWRAPTSFPDLSNSSTISIDLETYDPELEDNGPGWARGVGHVVGIAIGDDAGNGWYFPIRHEIMPEDNLPPEMVLDWVKYVVSDPNQAKVGANIIYDIGWLRQEGIEVKGPIYDVQYAEAILYESMTVALEDLAQRYLGMGKESNELYEWCAKYYGGNPGQKQRKNIYRSPPCLVGPYAESDAYLPVMVLRKQWEALDKLGLLDLFIMECEMIPLYIDMRFEGVSVNLAYAEETRDIMLQKESELQSNLDYIAGFGVNVNATDHLKRVFDKNGLYYPTTAKGNPSFRKEFLETLTDPVGALINEIRKLQKLRGTFVEGAILNSHINGKVYGQFHPLRGDDGGTRSGRYSSSTPNLQNIPSRDPVLAPMIRGMFIPDPGHVAWRKYDYSQIEYRFMVHYAVGAAGDRARRFFNEHPDTDYHDFAQKLIFDKLGRWIERKPIKNINFGLIYGMGLAKLANDLGLSKKDAADLINAYFDAVDFAKPTMNACMDEAQKTGLITTILGRRSQFELWEPAAWGSKGIALPFDKAIRRYGDIKRAYTHKALNRRLQGSAADLMKKAMHKCYKDGVFDYIGVPRLTVHDEMDFSDKGGVDDGFKEMQRIMETAIKLKIPVKADGEIGPDWGHVEAIED
ncbi:DNA polymerase I [Shewanella phage S0112]|nr:DNA polymerase I [Shewanella phage S0112]